ncbi:hypothetical protein QTG56_23510 (plasmid) [Rossellomorea sp. AcN35-11]|nr:hypothetical protein [Rossellomorea aquimaris]WJV32332.1 hypothetical protein QTG56_23510 [Rossellomorea sp. AcN35-11]
MATKRNDSWDGQKDKLLLETVLEHIMTGSTQLKAFEVAAKRIGKTAGACGFRWNNHLRKENKKLIELAKKDGEKAKGKISKEIEATKGDEQPVSKETSAATIIPTNEKNQPTSKKLSFVVNIKSRTEQILELVESLESELDAEKSSNTELEEKYDQLKKDYDEVVSFMSKFVQK